MSIQIFKTIQVVTPTEAIYRRLGFHQDVTRVVPEENKKYHQYIGEALDYIKLQGAALRIPINKKTKTMVSLATGDIFKSKLVAILLEKSPEILLLGATAGYGIIEAIQKSQEKDMTKSVVFDATASEMTDTCLTWMINYLSQKLSREKKQLTSKRISCGFGDFALSNQIKIYKLLKLKKLNINITNSFMLVPEKSVTALTGIVEK